MLFATADAIDAFAAVLRDGIGFNFITPAKGGDDDAVLVQTRSQTRC